MIEGKWVRERDGGSEERGGVECKNQDRSGEQGVGVVVGGGGQFKAGPSQTM